MSDTRDRRDLGAADGADGRLESRRRFTVEMAMALLGGAAVTIGCGGGGGGPAGPTPFVPPPSSPAPGSSDLRFGAIAANHGHEAMITAAQLLAGGALRLDITGGAAHTHVIELTADEVARIRDGAIVSTLSTEGVGLFGPHGHSVRFN